VAGKTRNEAKDNFCGFFKESLSCLTDAYLQPVQISDNRFLLTYEPPPDLACAAGPRTLSISQLFTVRPDTLRGGYRVKTLEYEYGLNGPDDDGNLIEIVSYHWHPDESAVREPHLHVGCVPRVHFPTSRISVERFIRMLIDYYGIEPILAPAKWKAILRKNDLAFDAMASWK
jgi:hypothetical protein